MMVWIISSSLIFVDENLSPVELKHGKVYEIPNFWAKEIIKEEMGAEYIKK